MLLFNVFIKKIINASSQQFTAGKSSQNINKLLNINKPSCTMQKKMFFLLNLLVLFFNKVSKHS